MDPLDSWEPDLLAPPVRSLIEYYEMGTGIRPRPGGADDDLDLDAELRAHGIGPSFFDLDLSDTGAPGGDVGPAGPTGGPWEDPEGFGPGSEYAERTFEFLVDELGVDLSELAEVDWRFFAPPAGGPLLLVPAKDPAGRVLSVRALGVDTAYWTRPNQRTEESTPIAVQYEFEANPETTLAVADVPAPLGAGLFDGALTWVSHDPVDALFLTDLGVRATSLAYPSDTLGTPEGLWQLSDLGALTPRKTPRGTLVVVDTGVRLTLEQGGLLKGLFEEVWELPNATGREWIRRFREAKDDGEVGDPTRFFLDYARKHPEQWRCPHPPAPLPARWGAAGRPAPLEDLSLVTVAEMAESASKGTEWLVEGFVAPGAITELQGVPKEGKSTLALPMMAALSRADGFLGRPPPSDRPCPVVYVTEQTRRTAYRSLERGMPKGRDLPALPDLHFLPVEKLYGRGWDEVVAFVRRECKRLGARVAVFDTLSQVAGVEGDAENSAGAARGLYRSLRPLTFDGVAVLAVRHSRKAGGTISATGLGSIAVAGEADHLVRLRRVAGRPNVRRVDTVGRIGDDEDMLIEMTDEGWVQLAEKPGEAPEDGTAREWVLEQLEAAGNEGLPERDLLDRVGGTSLSKAGVQRALRELLREGEIEGWVLAERGSPHLYRKVSSLNTPLQGARPIKKK